MANARLAFNVLVSRDPATARQLVQEKDRLRDLEKATSQSHFVRLRDGTAKSVETSSIHLDTIRDLKQINSLLASMAYPVLEEQGLLERVTAEGGLIRARQGTAALATPPTPRVRKPSAMKSLSSCLRNLRVRHTDRLLFRALAARVCRFPLSPRPPPKPCMANRQICVNVPELLTCRENAKIAS